jgi:uncharacterized membrane protein YvlD (DUF360 family)
MPSSGGRGRPGLVTLPLAILALGIAWFFVSLLMLAITKGIVSGPWQITGKRRRLNRG